VKLSKNASQGPLTTIAAAGSGKAAEETKSNAPDLLSPATSGATRKTKEQRILKNLADAH
jgi:hypothetical protein